MVELVAVADLTFALHAPFRAVLACRPAPPAVDVAAAVESWLSPRHRQAYERWLAAGADGGQPRAKFYLDHYVQSIRFAAHVRTVRAKAKRIAYGDALLEPPPPLHLYLEDDLAYGRHCHDIALRRGIPTVEPRSDEAFRTYGASVRARWHAAYRRADEGCPYPPGGGLGAQAYQPSGGLCALAYPPSPPPYAAFWRLVADERPVVISRTSGRLIDGLRRVEAHRAAGGRSPGVPVEWREYDDEQYELIDVCALNAKNPDLPPAVRAAIAAAPSEHYRRQAARNSGRSRYHEPEWSGPPPPTAGGRRGPPRPPKPPVRVVDRLAALAGMSRPTFEKYRPRDAEGAAGAQAPARGGGS